MASGPQQTASFILGGSRKPNKPDGAVFSDCLHRLIQSSGRHGTSVCCKCHRIKNSLGKEYSPRIHPGHGMEKAGRGETSIFNSHCVSLICTSKASYTLFAAYIVCQQVICFRHSSQASVLFRIFFCEAFLKSTSYWKTFKKKIFLVIS